MKLKEFSLWAYKLDLKDSREFTLENRSVCAHFERHFKSLENQNVYRVVVKLSTGDNRDGTVEISSSVLKYYDKFDFETYQKFNDDKRKEILLDTLYNSLIKVSRLMGWPKDSFEIAKEMVIKEKYDNSYEFRKKNNRARNKIASLYAEHTNESYTLSLIVKDKNDKIIQRKILLSEEPDEFIFNGQIGDIKWVSNDTLQYIAKDKRVIETITIN